MAAHGQQAVCVRATSSDASGARDAGEGGDTPDSTRANNRCILLGHPFAGMLWCHDERPTRAELTERRSRIIGTLTTAGNNRRGNLRYSDDTDVTAQVTYSGGTGMLTDDTCSTLPTVRAQP